MSGWQSVQGAFDQVPDTSPISDCGAVHDGGYTQRPPVEPHVHGQRLAALSSSPFSLFIDTLAIRTAFCFFFAASVMDFNQGYIGHCKAQWSLESQIEMDRSQEKNLNFPVSCVFGCVATVVETVQRPYFSSCVILCYTYTECVCSHAEFSKTQRRQAVERCVGL